MKSYAQLCCNPMDCNLPGSSAHGIFQARILEWVTISFSSKDSNAERDCGQEEKGAAEDEMVGWYH